MQHVGVLLSFQSKHAHQQISSIFINFHQFHLSKTNFINFPEQIQEGQTPLFRRAISPGGSMDTWRSLASMVKSGHQEVQE